MKFDSIYLLHGKGGSPNGSVRLLEDALRALLDGAQFLRPSLPHSDYHRPAEDSVDFLHQMQIAPRALVVGISLGGLVAAKLQETGRPDLVVVCISSPTWADAVSLEQHVGDRTAIYSSTDTVIAGRTFEWPRLARAHDVPWLTHNTDEHLPWLTPAIAASANGEDPGEILARY
jgi:pimeloyl-ACP methyl ester carboxylesterase